MSSGTAEVPLAGVFIMVAVPGAAPVILAAAVVTAAFVAAGAVAVLVTRAAMAGAEALAGGLVQLGDLLESQHETYVQAQRAAELWQLAVIEVVDRNARIAAMTASLRSLGADGHGPDVPIPPPFDITGKNLCDVYDWCRRTDEQLARSRRELGKVAVAAACKRIAASLPASDVRLIPAVEAIAKRKAELATAVASIAAKKIAATASGDRAAAALTDVARQVDVSLAELDPGARPSDYSRALEVAARATTESLSQALSHLDHLRLIVSEANKKADDARTAARLLQGLQQDPAPCDLDGQSLAVMGELEAVLSGERELDDALVTDAHQVLRTVEAAGLRMYLREQVRQIMEENGYEVEGDFTTLRPGADSLTLSRPDWAEHHLRIVLGNDELRYLTLRDHEVAGDDAARLDHERCEQVATDARHLADTLSSRGLELGAIIASDDPPVHYLAGTPAARTVTATPASQPRQASLRLPDTDAGPR